MNFPWFKKRKSNTNHPLEWNPSFFFPDRSIMLRWFKKCVWWNSIWWKFNLGIWWNSVRPKFYQWFKTNFANSWYRRQWLISDSVRGIKSVIKEIWVNSGLSMWHFWMTSFVYTMVPCTCVAHSSLSHFSTNANFIDNTCECMAKEISRKYIDTSSEN